MTAIKAYFDGTVFVPLSPVNVKRNQNVIITVLDDIKPDVPAKPFEKYIGKLSTESYAEITEALLEVQKIDQNEW